TEVMAALRGRVTDDHDGVWLAVAVPLQDEEHVVGAARAAIAWTAVTHDTDAAWLLMVGFGAAAVLLAGVVAWWQASRLVAPVEGVAALALKLGAGDVAAGLAPAGV